MEIVHYGTITVIVGLLVQAIKQTPIDNKWLPTISGVIGAILGIICFYVIPNFPVDNIISALGVGIISGEAAVGAHQTVKQLNYSDANVNKKE